MNRVYENQNFLSLYLVSFLVGLRTYQHACVSSDILDYAKKSEQVCNLFFVEKNTENMLPITFHVHSNRKVFNVKSSEQLNTVYMSLSIYETGQFSP